jgi:hypothetical protein
LTKVSQIDQKSRMDFGLLNVGIGSGAEKKNLEITLILLD